MRKLKKIFLFPKSESTHKRASLGMGEIVKDSYIKKENYYL